MDDRHGNFNMLTNKEASRLKKKNLIEMTSFVLVKRLQFNLLCLKFSKIWPNGKMMLKLQPAVIDESKLCETFCPGDLSVEEIKDMFVKMIDTCGD